MEITNVSVTEYLDTCMSTAYQRGFLWVMVLLARERDATHSYQDLTEYWESFNDLTGDSILFVLSAKNKKTSHLLNYKYNPNVFVANKLWHDCDIPHLYTHRHVLQKRNQAIYNNTHYISEIRHKYSISEESIPAILLFKLNSNGHEKPVVVPISEDNLYETIQGLITATEHISNRIKELSQRSFIRNPLGQGKNHCDEDDLQTLHQQLDDAVLQYAHRIIHKENQRKMIMSNTAHFKIGITFSGKYRDTIIEPTARALLKMGFTDEDIFYDYWHRVRLNGVNGDNTIRDIYRNRCDCIVVLLSPDYMEKDWTRNIEWPAVKELINTGNSQKICLLGIDSVKIDEIDGLHENQAIVEPIDNMLPDEIADFILLKYSLITNS